MTKEQYFSFKHHLSLKRNTPALQFLLSLLLTVLAGLVLFQATLFNALTATVISVGLDTLRSQLIAALLLTASSAFIGAALGRRKLAAFIGASSVFCNKFLIGFFVRQRLPILDPGGHPEPLSSTALYSNSTMILGLGLLSAFMGLAVGMTFGEVVLEPPYRILCFCWHYCRKLYDQKRFYCDTTKPLLPPQKLSLPLLARCCSAALVIVLIILASHSSNLFIFSPDIGIHTHPVFRDSTGQVVTGTIVPGNMISPALRNQRRPFLVYLPPSYNLAEGRKKFYPTLYLLHGSPGKDFDWIIGGKAAESADTLIALYSISELIMVFPDGNGAPGASSEWGNSGDSHQLMENFVANDLVKYIDQHYRTIPNAQHRAIGGLSMGGFGAMNIAIHHPNVFGSVISLGGYYKAEGSIWGSATYYQQLNSPLNTLPTMPQAWQLRLFLGAATKDEPYYQNTLEFMHELDRLHIHYHFDLQVGRHAWIIWQKQLYNALEWLPWNQQLFVAHTKIVQ